MSDGRTELYRHFDAEGNLLYVGISLSTAKRLGEHRNKAAWFRKVKTITIEHYPSRKAALDAERKAVQTEHPQHNVTGKLRGFRTGGSTTPPPHPLRVAVDKIMENMRREVDARAKAEA